jgi:hypothetical protein
VAREKQLTTGKAVFEVEFALLHQQREMNSLKAGMGEVKAEMGEVTRMLVEQRAETGEVTRMLRLLLKDSAQVCHTALRVCFASDVRQPDGDVY